MYDIVIFGEDKPFLNDLAGFLQLSCSWGNLILIHDGIRFNRYLSYRQAAAVFFLETGGVPRDCYQVVEKLRIQKKGDVIILLAESEECFHNLDFVIKQACFNIIYKYGSGLWPEIHFTVSAGRRMLGSRNLYLSEDGFIYSLTIAAISYIESGRGQDRGKVVIHHESGTYKNRSTLQQMMAHLADHGFIRCHNSFIVNQDFILEINYSKRILILRDEAICPFTKNSLSGIMLNRNR